MCCTAAMCQCQTEILSVYSWSWSEIRLLTVECVASHTRWRDYERRNCSLHNFSSYPDDNLVTVAHERFLQTAHFVRSSFLLLKMSRNTSTFLLAFYSYNCMVLLANTKQRLISQTSQRCYLVWKVEYIILTIHSIHAVTVTLRILKLYITH